VRDLLGAVPFCPSNLESSEMSCVAGLVVFLAKENARIFLQCAFSQWDWAVLVFPEECRTAAHDAGNDDYS